MGNIFSVTIPYDPTANFCCWGFLSQQANYISKLGESLEALDRSLQELTALKNDVVRRVEVAEVQTSMMRLDQVPHFDPVIWIVVSKDHKLEILQDKIGERLGILNDKWKHNEPHEKAQHIFKFLSKKKFVLLLDDIWEPIEMTKVGIHNPAIPNPVTPGPANNKKSKIIFTTRLEHICSCMDAEIKKKVMCLMLRINVKVRQVNNGRLCMK